MIIGLSKAFCSILYNDMIEILHFKKGARIIKCHSDKFKFLGEFNVPLWERKEPLYWLLSQIKGKPCCHPYTTTDAETWL
jgi:hypothetical protein